MPNKSSRKPRTKPSEQRRDDILRSARRCFLDKGIEQTTVEEITQGADVAKGTFYLYFSSKGDVVEALRDGFVQGLLKRIAEESGERDPTDWRGKLTAWSNACAAGYLDAARLHHLVFTSSPPPKREGLSRNALIDDLIELLAAGRRANAWRVDDPGFTAIFLFNALHGVVDRQGVALDDEDRRNLLCSIEAHFHRVVV